MFSREFCEIFKNTFFSEHLRATASEQFIPSVIISMRLKNIKKPVFCCLHSRCIKMKHGNKRIEVGPYPERISHRAPKTMSPRNKTFLKFTCLFRKKKFHEILRDFLIFTPLTTNVERG